MTFDEKLKTVCELMDYYDFNYNICDGVATVVQYNDCCEITEEEKTFTTMKDLIKYLEKYYIGQAQDLGYIEICCPKDAINILKEDNDNGDFDFLIKAFEFFKSQS